MRIAVCDDEQKFCKELLDYLQMYFTDNHLKQPEYLCYNSGEELLKEEKVIDIVFLDVEMREISGIHTGERLKRKNNKVIIFIITAFPDYLDEAMSFRVFRYLSKPVDKRRLFRNMKAALRQYNTVIHKIGIETKTGIYTVYVSDIIYVEAVNRKTVVHTIKGDYESVYPLKYWQENLRISCFFQTHKSFIVNMKHIQRFDNNLVYFCNNTQAYLTKRKYKEFKDSYLLYLESMK